MVSGKALGSGRTLTIILLEVQCTVPCAVHCVTELPDNHSARFESVTWSHLFCCYLLIVCLVFACAHGGMQKVFVRGLNLSHSSGNDESLTGRTLGNSSLRF